MKTVVNNIKNIISKSINFAVKFAPLASVVVGVAGMAMGLVAAPVALTAIGGVVLVCSTIETVLDPSVKNVLTTVVEIGIARIAGYAVLGKVTIWVVGLQLMLAAVVLGAALIVAVLLAAYIGGKKMIDAVNSENVAVTA